MPETPKSPSNLTIPAEFSAVIMPGSNKSYVEFVAELCETPEIKNAISTMPPRWLVTFPPDFNQKSIPEQKQILSQHAKKYTIMPNLFVSSGLQRDRSLLPQDDSAFAGHLVNTHDILRDALLCNLGNQQENNSHNDLINTVISELKTDFIRPEKTTEEAQFSAKKLFAEVTALTMLMHDLHEFKDGDSTSKDANFKRGELYSIYSETCPRLLQKYRDDLQKEDVSNQEKESLFLQFRYKVLEMFKIFTREQKLQKKYQISDESIVDLFAEKNYDTGIFGKSIDEILDESNTDLYRNWSQVYEQLHDMTFLSAVISSSIKTKPTTPLDQLGRDRAMQFDVLQNALTHMFLIDESDKSLSYKLPYQRDFMSKNSEQILHMLEKIKAYDKQILAFRQHGQSNLLTTTEIIQQRWNRVIKMPVDAMTQLMEQICKSL